MLKKASICIYAFLLAATIAWKTVEIRNSYETLGKPISVKLSRNSFTALDFPSLTTGTRAVILFGSGDGGWSSFEEEICQTLQGQGYDVIGIDSNAYAKSDYDLQMLQSDFARIAGKAETAYGKTPPPLILGGYSMGAAQAIAAAGGPHPPQGLVGLLLVDPCSRGRYGLRLSDQADILPTGPGTFGVNEFAQTMGSLRVVQWHAVQDSIDSTAWLHSLTAQHREFDFPHTDHHYNHDRPEFLHQLIESVDWILNPPQEKAVANGSNG